MTSIKQYLGFDGFLIKTTDVRSRYPDYLDIEKIGADSVYFCSGRPAVLFLNVMTFDETTLQRISRVQHNAWNYQRVMLLYVTSETEIRIYNCYEKPVNPNSNDEDDKQLKSIQLKRFSVGENLELLEKLFSRVSVDSGALWTADSELRNKIKKERRVDEYLISSMKVAAQKLGALALPSNIIHSLLIRSLFILFLEDKGASRDAGLYETIMPGAKSYFDILKDKGASYRLFKRLQEQFNGNITTLEEGEESQVSEQHLDVIRDCFLDGDFSHQPLLFERAPLFNFEIIQIGLISDIYENFLGEMQDERGQFYTPFSLVDMILSEVLPTSEGESEFPLLDMSCGSGIFLVEGYRRLISRWKRTHNGQRITFDVLVSLLKNNIFGVEIDATAIRVAAFSLYLTLIDQLDPKILWNQSNNRLPYLIYDPDDSSLANKQGCNLLRRNTISEVDPKQFSQIKLLVGNPPYGTKDLKPEIKQYCQRLHFAEEYVLPFMHKATLFCPSGTIALVFTSKVLFNTGTGYANFRKWLFNENSVSRVDNLSIFRKAPRSYGGGLFTSANCPVSVAYYTAGKADRNDTVRYYSPKTFVKSNLIDGLVIDDSDVKFLPMTECQNPDSNIWKAASWGNYYGFKLIERLSSRKLSHYFKEHGWNIGRGVIADSERQDFIPERIIGTEVLSRYYTDLSVAKFNINKRYREVKVGLFEPPFVVFKQGQHNGEIACSYFEEKVYSTSTATILNSTSEEDKKILTAYLNSRIAKYFLLLTTSSWGIEREQIYSNEVQNIPSPFEGLTPKARRIIVRDFDQLYALSKGIVTDSIKIQELEVEIEREFEQAFLLTERDVVYLNDTLDYNFGIFQKGFGAEGYHRVLSQESREYAETLFSSLLKLLKGTTLQPEVTFYDSTANDPLQLVMVDLKATKEGVSHDTANSFRQSLRKIDESLWSRQSESVYLRKTLKYYDGSQIYLIKPNQKRFWSKMQAFDDAASIVNDIMSM